MGPGGEDFAFGVPVLIPDLESAAARWPVFVPAAVAAGAQALFAVPLQAGAIQVGVLSMYRSQPGSLTAAQLADGLVLADIALQDCAGCGGGHQRVAGLPAPWKGLSDRRAEVHQAAGMISVQLGVELAEAPRPAAGVHLLPAALPLGDAGRRRSETAGCAWTLINLPGLEA